LNIKKTTKYDAENLGPVSGQAQKCGNVKLNKMIIISQQRYQPSDSQRIGNTNDLNLGEQINQRAE
jgi:hypothetical protein